MQARLRTMPRSEEARELRLRTLAHAYRRLRSRGWRGKGARFQADVSQGPDHPAPFLTRPLVARLQSSKVLPRIHSPRIWTPLFIHRASTP